MKNVIEKKSEKYLQKYQKAEINALLVWERVMKLLDNMLDRIERQMFGGLQYKSDLPVNADLVKLITDIGRVVKDLTKLHLQIMKADASAINNRSLNEKIEFVVRFITNLPPGYRKTCIEQLGSKLSISVARIDPVGRPSKSYIHPMDRP